MKRSTGQGSSQSEGNDVRRKVKSCIHDSRIYYFETFLLVVLSRTNFVGACALFGAFAVIKIFPARFNRISTGRSTPFCHIFWRGIKDCDKFTNISNSVDTLGVC